MNLTSYQGRPGVTAALVGEVEELLAEDDETISGNDLVVQLDDVADLRERLRHTLGASHGFRQFCLSSGWEDASPDPSTHS